MSAPSEKLVSHLADKINAKIVSGEYPPGTRLRQEALAEAFSVSRTPIREALRQLEVKGVVQHTPNQGATVRALSARDIREAYQVRAELEGLAAELAVEWITDAQIERIRVAQARFAQAVEQLAAAKDKKGPARNPAAKLPNWVEANDAFHAVILEASRNRRLSQVAQDMHIGFTRGIMMSALAMDGQRMRENVAQHDAILDAIERRDAAAARRSMTHHILRSGEIMVWWLESCGYLERD